MSAKNNKKTTVATSTTPDRYERVESGGFEELRGLLVGIKACAEVAKAHYNEDGDFHVDFAGLAQLAERATFVLLEIRSAERTGGAL